MNIYPVNQNDFSLALQLLKKNNLPTQDITDTTKLFALYHDNQLIGVAGIEQNGTAALLRSVCVMEEKRVNGAGSELVSFMENFAKETGAHTLYLLTTTAASFFSKRNYQTIDRKEVPAAIQQTAEFMSVCPSTATVMKKELAGKV